MNAGMIYSTTNVIDTYVYSALMLASIACIPPVIYLLSRPDIKGLDFCPVRAFAIEGLAEFS